MINAAVIVLVAGFSAAIAYIVGSRKATSAVLEEAEDRLSPAAAKDVIEELLANPDTSHLMKQVVRDYVQGRRVANGKKEKSVKGKTIIVPESGVLDETPDYGPFVVDSGLENIKRGFSNYDTDHPEGTNEFYDDADPTTDEGFEQWLASYDERINCE